MLISTLMVMADSSQDILAHTIDLHKNVSERIVELQRAVDVLASDGKEVASSVVVKCFVMNVDVSLSLDVEVARQLIERELASGREKQGMLQIKLNAARDALTKIAA